MALPLTNQFIPAYYFQQYFVDKDTGAPLAGGKIYFYRDSARTVLKPVYKITGTPPNYTATAMPNPIILNSVGTIDDGLGNDVEIFFDPYDDDGNIDLYYIEVYSAQDVLQFTREGEPNPNLGSEVSGEITNYVPDGQFLLHENMNFNETVGYSGLLPNQVIPGVVTLSPGGWTFETPLGNNAIDLIVFNRIGSYTANPTGSPRYACEIICESVGINVSYKNLCIRFDDVNKFASDTQQYTFSFSAICNTSSSFSIDISLFKNFGTGGSPSTSISIGSAVITNSWNIYNVTFTFGVNTGETIGSNDDDYLQLQINLPTNQLFDVEFTDFVLTQGDVKITGFPITTNREFIYESLASSFPVPNPNGMDLYLPIILGPKGLTYSDANVGKIFMSATGQLALDELECDGSMYRTIEYSSIGIPYLRLQQKLFNTTTLLPKYGTGSTYLTAVINTSPSVMIYNNSLGAATHMSDGTNPTGFTFSLIHEGDAGYGVNGYSSYQSPDVLMFLVNATSCLAGTSGFTVSSFDNGSNTIFTVKFIVPTALAGKYFTFEQTISNRFFIWFTVDGSGSQPIVPSHTPIQVNLLSTDTANDVANKVIQSINGELVQRISNITSGSVIPQSSWFNLYTQTTHFYVWFNIDSSGTDPAVVGATGIEVDINSTDTNTVVSTKMITAINSMYYAVPYYRGYFLRADDAGTGIDPGPRYNFIDITDSVGTSELSDNLSHLHTYTVSQATGLGSDVAEGNGGGPTQYSTTTSGIAESRPINKTVKMVIKY